MVNRATREPRRAGSLTEAEIEILDRWPMKDRDASHTKTVSHYLVADREAGRLPGAGEGPAAREHGDLARAHPAHRHHLGSTIGARVVGN